MFTTACAPMPAALVGARVRACVANPVVSTIDTTWYAPAMGASGFGHKHPSRRPPSPS